MRLRLALPVTIAASLAVTGCAMGAPESPVGYAETPDGSPTASAQGAAAEALAAVRDAAPEELDGGEPGVPQQSGASVDDVLRLGAVVTWIEEPSLFALSLPATEDCWPVAGDPVASSEHAVVVAVLQEEACAPPTAARTYRLEVPADVDAAPGLDISIVGLDEEYELRLPPS